MATLSSRSIVLLPVLSVLCGLYASLAFAAPLHVLIDPGHGGRDHGTVKESITEADITLSVARQLHRLLAKDKRFRAELTRDQDRTLLLGTRARIAKESHADIFLSIHVNSSPEARARGAEFYFQNQLPPDEESMFLAHKENEAAEGNEVKQTYDFVDHSAYPQEVTAIVSDLLDSERVRRSSQLSTALKSSWRGGNRKTKSNSIRQAPFYVLNQMATPSALVELGFLTNNEDARELTSASTQARMAEDLYRGLIVFAEAKN